MKLSFFPVLCAAVLLAAGCGKSKPKEVSSLARKEAANLLSEAQFAVQLKDLARAEPLVAKAAALCPDNGNYWLSLGTIHHELGRRDAARADYESAVRAFAAAYQASPKAPEPLVDRVVVLLALGRPGEARPLLERARRDHATHPRVRELGTLTAEQLQQVPAIKSLVP